MKKFIIGFVTIIVVAAIAALMIFTKPSGAIKGIKNIQGDYMMVANTTIHNAWEVKCYKRVVGDRYVESSLDDYISDLPMADAIEEAWKKAEEALDSVTWK